MPSAVIGGGEHGEQLAASEPFEPVHHTLMRPQDILGLVVIQELLDPIRSELDYVTSSVGVTDEVWLDTEFLIVVRGV